MMAYEKIENMISKLHEQGDIRLSSDRERDMLLFSVAFALSNRSGFKISDRLLKRTIVNCLNKMKQYKAS